MSTPGRNPPAATTSPPTKRPIRFPTMTKTMGESGFDFLDPGELADGELRIVLARCNPADPEKQWVPSYDFDLIVNAQKVGAINFRAQNTHSLEMYGGH